MPFLHSIAFPHFQNILFLYSMVFHSLNARTQLFFQQERTGSWMMGAILCFRLWTCQHHLASSVCSLRLCCPCLQHFLFYFEVCDPCLPVKFPTCVIGLPTLICSNCVSLSLSTIVYEQCFSPVLDRVVALSCAMMMRFVSCVQASFLELCTVAWLFDLLVVEPSDSLTVLPLSSWQDIKYLLVLCHFFDKSVCWGTVCVFLWVSAFMCILYLWIFPNRWFVVV